MGSSDPPAEASIRCTRCGGKVTPRVPKKERNPFMPRPPLHVVCADCGLEFDVEQPEMPPSGVPPWE